MNKCTITGLEFDDNLCSPVWHNGELVCAWVRRAIDSSDREEFIRILSLFRNVKVTEIQVDIIEILHPEYLTDTCKILYSLALWMRDKFWLRGFIIHFETAKDRLLFNHGSVDRFLCIQDGILHYGIEFLKCFTSIPLSDPQVIEKTQRAIEDDIQSVNRPLKDVL